MRSGRPRRSLQAIRNSPHALIWQSTPLLLVAVFVTLGAFWPLVGGIALWSLAAIGILAFAFGIWRQARRGSSS